MSQDYPQLTLDDLVHLMSPSPAPQTLQDDSDMSMPIKSPSPGPLPDSDVVQMRRKVIEMRHIEKPDVQLTAREKELAEMVLRLTTLVRPDSDQLIRQADLISALIQQRDLLLHQAEEQRLRWNSEKDGWARMAEALLAQQAKRRLDSEQDEDYERLQSVETDNKSLRQRLTETQSRLQLLESELTRLRPLLLMQPLITRTSMPPPTPNPKARYARRRKKDAVTTEDEEHGASEDEPLTDHLETPSQASHSQPTPRVKSRKSESHNVHPPTHAHKRRPGQKATSRGLSADARAEHLLLAARKIGKQRAGIMSGIVQHLEELERERRREESATTAIATTPKTPKRNMTRVAYPPEGGYVYVNGQIRPGPGVQPVPLFFPACPHHHLLQTPSSSTTAPSVTSSTQKQKQDARTNNPQTPLDSLLSAARSMMCEDVDVEVDEDEEVDVVGDLSSQTIGARRTRTRDAFGSPVPKRRKVASRADKSTVSHELTSRLTNSANLSSVNTSRMTNAGPGRVRSALDVLADQAAAFSTQEQSAASSQKKGNGKEKIDAQLQGPSSSTPKSRGRTKSRRKGPEVDTPSSVAPTSRSRTPQSDLDNPAGSSPAAGAGGFGPEALVDPGGGTSSPGTSNPSLSPTFDSTLVSEGDQVTTNNDAQSPRLLATSVHIDDSVDATPRQGSRIFSEDSARVAVAQPGPVPLPEPLPENERHEALPHSETIPSTTSTALAENKELTRVAEQDMSAPKPPAKRQRSPYVKWSKEEDDLLAQAVAKYGQKWDLVQKALPSRGYHQVRQRWLRKLGVFDNKPDLSSFQTAATTFSSTSRGDGVEPRGNPKLGLAPLSSERAFSGLVGRPPSMPP